MDAIREAALRYIAQGLAVVPLYGLDVDDHCTCKLGEACGANAGKHPYAPLAPHGSKDATSDPAAVDAWPDGLNLGITPTSTLVCLDFDEPNIVSRVLDLVDNDPEGAHTAQRTRKGVHLWVRCDDTPGTIFKDANGLKLGDVKARGLVVVAPSRFPGGQYRWMGDGLDSVPAVAVPGTAVDHAERLLKRLGVALATTQRGASWSAPRSPVPPFPTGQGQIAPAALETLLDPDEFADEVDLRQLNTGMFPTDDRSDTLYRFACDIWRALDRRKLTPDPVTIVAVVKDLDARCAASGSFAGGAKFVGRPDCDLRLWECVLDARDAVTTEAAKQAAGSTPPPLTTAGSPPTGNTAPGGGSTSPGGGGGTGTPPQQPPGGGTTGAVYYYFDNPSGWFYHQGLTSRGRPGTRTPVCSFDPYITEIQKVWRDEDSVEVHWVARLGAVEARLGPPEITDDRLFRRTVSGLLSGHPGHTVISWGHLRAGMEDRRSQHPAPVERESFGMGWVPGRDIFVLPGATVTADGLSDDYQFWETDGFPIKFRAYGVGVAPNPRASDALGALLHCARPDIVISFLSYVLGQQLQPLLPDAPHFILESSGATGSLKTTTLMTFLCLQGDFYGNGKIGSWSSTPASTGRFLYEARHVVYASDDRKVGTGNPGSVGQYNTLVQNYADSTNRGRLNRNSSLQRDTPARGGWATTGEDPLEGGQSVAARSIQLRFERDPFWSRAMREMDALRPALGGVGFSWLHWLCRAGQNALRMLLPPLFERMNRETALTMDGVHPRVIGNLAVLKTYATVIESWITDSFPEHLDQFIEVARAGWEAEAEVVKEEADEAALEAPLAALLHWAYIQFKAGHGTLVPRDGTSQRNQGASSIGWIDENYVWINEHITFDQYRRALRQAGRDALFSWKALTAAAKTAGYSVDRAYFEGTQLRAIRVPREDFFPPDPDDSIDVDALIRNLFDPSSPAPEPFPEAEFDQPDTPEPKDEPKDDDLWDGWDKSR